MKWVNRSGLVMVHLPGDSSTLRAIGAIVRKHGMAGARAPSSYHVTLGQVASLPPTVRYPTNGAAPAALPQRLVDDLCAASWAVTIARRAGGSADVSDAERAPI